MAKVILGQDDCKVEKCIVVSFHSSLDREKGACDFVAASSMMAPRETWFHPTETLHHCQPDPVVVPLSMIKVRKPTESAQEFDCSSLRAASREQLGDPRFGRPSSVRPVDCIIR